MRISDWSSDVCSSDLNVYLVKRERGGTSLVLVDELGNASGDRVSRDGGAHGLHWHAGGDALTWVNGSSLNRLSVRRSGGGGADGRSAERRVGTECVSKGRSRWSPYY